MQNTKIKSFSRELQKVENGLGDPRSARIEEPSPIPWSAIEDTHITVHLAFNISGEYVSDSDQRNLHSRAEMHEVTSRSKFFKQGRESFMDC